MRGVDNKRPDRSAPAAQGDADHYAAQGSAILLTGEQRAPRVKAERGGDLRGQGAVAGDHADPAGGFADRFADRAAAAGKDGARVDPARYRTATAAERRNAAVEEAKIEPDERLRRTIRLIDDRAARDPALAEPDREGRHRELAVVERQRAGEGLQRRWTLPADDVADAKGNGAVRLADLCKVDAGVGNDAGANRALFRGGAAQPLVGSEIVEVELAGDKGCLLYTSPSPRDRTRSRMPSSA